MDELIDVLTSEGNPTGKSFPKSVIHKEGLYHNTAHIWFYTKNGEILLAQRSFKKIICPGLWDVSVAGHVDAKETIESAAIRESKEELDIEICPDDLQKIGVFKCCQSYENGIEDNEFHHTYICELHQNLETIKFQDLEVHRVKLVSTDEFLALLENSSRNHHFVGSNKSYYIIIIEAIRAKLKI